MSIKEIKRQAKTTLANLSGKYLLFLIPTILTIFHFSIEVHQGYVMATGIKMSLILTTSLYLLPSSLPFLRYQPPLP